MINEFLQSMTSWLNTVTGNNAMIAGAASLWFFGVLSYICKGVPTTIWGLISRQLYTSVTISDTSKTFEYVLHWMNKHGYDKYFREKRISGRTGDNLVAYGSHWCLFGYTPIQITHTCELLQGVGEKEYLHFFKYGRSYKVINDLLQAVLKEGEEEDLERDTIRIYSEDSYLAKIHKRGFDTVIIDIHQEQNLLNTLKQFTSNEEWYKENGIPYQLGILLYGSPGTGKSSVIKAIASYFNRDIRMFKASKLDLTPETLGKNIAMDEVGVIEDIDSCLSFQTRSSTDVEHRHGLSMEDACKDTSGLLNAIDGMGASHGRVLIMTTNHPEKIDPAFLRPGRCDLKVEIGYFNDEMFNRFLKRFFVDTDTKMVGRTVKPFITGSVLQQSVILKHSIDEIIATFTIPVVDKEVPNV